MPTRRSKYPTRVIELEVAEGLEQIALDELLERYADRIATQPVIEPGAIRFGYQGNLGGLLGLQAINAAYLLQTYDIPRPKAFLGHQHLTRLLDQIGIALSLKEPNAYTTIHINAAGSSSSVMQRLLSELAGATNLQPNNHEGDLMLRLRRAAHGEGWDALVRLSPRPNATRDWRVVDVPGALNGAVAFAMSMLTDPTPDDVVLNALCGSASLAIERRRLLEAEKIYACDRDADMLAAATQNIAAAGFTDDIAVRPWDATDVPLPPGSVNTILADLPFGNHVGSHKENIDLYPRLLIEAARLAKRGGRFILITHEVTLMDAVLADTNKWATTRTMRIGLSGLHPRIYLLERV